MLKKEVELTYRGISAEYIEHKDLWRLFNKKKPNDTIAYLDGYFKLDWIIEDIDFYLNHGKENL